jgi:DNA-binding response OmpR family regulator
MLRPYARPALCRGRRPHTAQAMHMPTHHQTRRRVGSETRALLEGRAPVGELERLRPSTGPSAREDAGRTPPLRSIPTWTRMDRMSTESARPRVLIVEDEVPIRELLRLHLDLAGFDVEEVGDGRAALNLARTSVFALLILDVMLPGLDGVTLCRAVRADSANRLTPILMLTARDTESDKVVGLESGADDYMTKPFGIRELLARVGAITRRVKRADDAALPAKGTHVTSSVLALDRDKREARVRGELVELTRQEFDLLYQLAARPGIVFSRASLLDNVWSDDTYVTERTVDTVISRLRRKIERDPQDPEMILTAWGIGYKFVDAE